MHATLREMKRVLVCAVLYTGLATSANAADWSAVEDLRAGDMSKLVFFADPAPAPVAEFITFDDEPIALDAYRGQIVLLNFWATWCAPCRKEMPMLAELQSEFGGEDFAVVTVATGRNAPPAMTRFFDSIGVDNLPLYRDPQQALAREMGVLGLPTTMILGRDGREIARLQGDANWASDSAKAIVKALIDVGS